MNPEDLIRCRTEMTLACVEYAGHPSPSHSMRVLKAAKEYGALLAPQAGEEGHSVLPANPLGTGSVADSQPSEGNPLAGAGSFSFPETPSRLIKREDVEPQITRCQNCGEAVKPLYCSAKCADEYNRIL